MIEERDRHISELEEQRHLRYRLRKFVPTHVIAKRRAQH
jgi:hypothetical protein